MAAVDPKRFPYFLYFAFRISGMRSLVSSCGPKRYPKRQRRTYPIPLSLAHVSGYQEFTTWTHKRRIEATRTAVTR